MSRRGHKHRRRFFILSGAGTPAVPGDDLITEGSDLMVSETGDQLTTE